MILFICWVRGGLERVVCYDIVYLLGKGWFRESSTL